MRWFAVLAATVGLVLVACGDEGAEMVPVSGTPSATSTAPTVTPQASGNTLCVPDPSDDIIFTEEQKQSIINAAEADPTMASLMGSVERSPLVAGSAWPFAQDVHFVNVSFGLSEMVPVNANLPSLDMGGRGGECTPSQLPPPGYVVRQEHYELEAGIITATMIYETGEVVGIFPVPMITVGSP